MALLNTKLDLISDGTAAAPSLRFSSSLTTGLFSPAADSFGVTTGGTRRLLLNSTGATLAASAIIDTDGGDLTLQANADVSGRVVAIKYVVKNKKLYKGGFV